jgi:hypothetical protein
MSEITRTLQFPVNQQLQCAMNRLELMTEKIRILLHMDSEMG